MHYHAETAKTSSHGITKSFSVKANHSRLEKQLLDHQQLVLAGVVIYKYTRMWVNNFHLSCYWRNRSCDGKVCGFVTQLSLHSVQTKSSLYRLLPSSLSAHQKLENERENYSLHRDFSLPWFLSLFSGAIWREWLWSEVDGVVAGGRKACFLGLSRIRCQPWWNHQGRRCLKNKFSTILSYFAIFPNRSIVLCGGNY